MAAYGLYTHIRSNRRRSVALLAGLFFLVYLMAFAGSLVAEAGVAGHLPFEAIVARAFHRFLSSWLWVTLGTVAWVLIAYRFNQAMIDGLTGAREVTRREDPRLYNLLENLCISRGIAMPKLKVMDSPALNAFASGLNPQQYSVTVTSGLMRRLNDAELEAVLAHELTHIRNGDVRMMVIAVIIAGCISFFAEIVFRMMFHSRIRVSGGNDRRGGGAGLAILLAAVLIAAAWFLSLVIRFALSRSREFLADAGAVELTGNADAMIRALRKIENRGELEGVTSAVMEMCVDNPRAGFVDLFASHPSIDRRVEALVKMAGGRDPGPIALPEPGAETPAEENGPQSGPWGDAPPEQPRQNPLPNPLPFPGGGPWGAGR